MPTPLLTTKLLVPLVRRNLVPRPRLTERLHAGLAAACKLTLVSAPAGYGKTTLLKSHVHNVLGKLGVEYRPRAIARVRELELI